MSHGTNLILRMYRELITGMEHDKAITLISSTWGIDREVVENTIDRVSHG
jgi:hypothetical protein